MSGHGSTYRRRSPALCWASAAMILGWGITLALPGDTIGSFPAYALLARLFPEDWWAAVLIFVGVARMGALIINGRMPRGSPTIRCAACIAGVMIWLQFLWSFVDFSWRVGAVSGGLTIYLVLVGADVFSAGRAAWDVAARWR